MSEQRIALVTGGSRGIGRAIARRLAADGMAVAVNYSTSADMADEVVADVTGAGGVAIAVGCDVSDEASVDQMFTAIEQELGPVAVLVNNAGITRDGLAARMSTEDFTRVLAVNLTSTFLCSRRSMRNMMKARWGRMINLSSVSGIGGNPGQSNYSASKAGIIGFTRSLAQELGSRSITVNAVAPGFIETDMTSDVVATRGDEIAERVALGRMGTPEEIAAAVAFLASEDASYINGHVLVVDGGLAL